MVILLHSNPTSYFNSELSSLRSSYQVIQIKKALIITYVFQKYPENFALQLFIILQ